MHFCNTEAINHLHKIGLQSPLLKKIFKVRLAVFLKYLEQNSLACLMQRSDEMLVMASCNVKNQSLTPVMPQERLSLTSDRTGQDLLTFLTRNEGCLQKLLCDFLAPGMRLLGSLCKYCCFWSCLNFTTDYRAQRNRRLPGYCRTKLSLSILQSVLTLQRKWDLSTVTTVAEIINCITLWICLKSWNFNMIFAP